MGKTRGLGPRPAGPSISESSGFQREKICDRRQRIGFTPLFTGEVFLVRHDLPCRDSRTPTGFPVRHVVPAVVPSTVKRQTATNLSDSSSMTPPKQPGAKTRIGAAGLAFLAITSIGWGFNWPVTKYLIGYLPPLTLRGTTGVIGASQQAVIAQMWGQSLRVPRELWPRRVVAAILIVGC